MDMIVVDKKPGFLHLPTGAEVCARYERVILLVLSRPHSIRFLPSAFPKTSLGMNIAYVCIENCTLTMSSIGCIILKSHFAPLGPCNILRS